MEHQEYCPYHPRELVTQRCFECDIHMCNHCNVAEHNKPSLCRDCEVKLNEQGAELSLEERQQLLSDAEELKAEKGINKGLMYFQYAIVAAALIIVPFKFFKFENQPTQTTVNLSDAEEVSDECIMILFDISEMLLMDELLPTDLKCPGNSSPLIVSRTSGDIVVSVPTPQQYGFSEMRVSKSNPDPELID